jgi:hypothetical protein
VSADPSDIGFEGASAVVVDFLFIVEALVLVDDLVLKVAVQPGLPVVAR